MAIEIQPSLGLKDAIEQRRAAQSFHPDPIPEVLVEEILRLGLRSPSGYNLQPWRFIVLQHQASKKKLQACAGNQAQIVQAPVVLICCGDRAVAQSEYIESIIELGQKNAALTDDEAGVLRTQIPSFFGQQASFGSIEAWTNRHTMLAVAHIMIAAQSYGVDSCLIEELVAVQVKAAFDIPDHLDVCCILCLGYAAEPFKRFRGRFAYPQVCYAERYGPSFNLE